MSNSVQSHLYPAVQCPGCKTSMQVIVVESGPSDFHTATYRCEHCGTETQRIFKRRED